MKPRNEHFVYCFNDNFENKVVLLREFDVISFRFLCIVIVQLFIIWQIGF